MEKLLIDRIELIHADFQSKLETISKYSGNFKNKTEIIVYNLSGIVHKHEYNVNKIVYKICHFSHNLGDSSA